MADDPFEEIDVFGSGDDEGKEAEGTREAEGEARDAVEALDEAGPWEDADIEAGSSGEDDGSCHLCDAPGRNTCVSCERGVCSDHFWVMFALCRDCATEEDIQRLQGRRDDAYWSDVLDIKWVR